MGNISLFVLASDVNDLNGGALTANFSHLLRDPVQITLNRPLISNWLRASHFQRCTAALRTPGNSKKITHSELHRSIGLRLTSIDRNDLYRHNATIDRESLGEFQFRRSVFLPRAMSRFYSTYLPKNRESNSRRICDNATELHYRCGTVQLRSRNRLHRKWLYVFSLVSLSPERTGRLSCH